MKEVRDLACDIVLAFEEVLIEKNIRVPCSNEVEEAERKLDNNVADQNGLYGSEFWGLVDTVQNILEDEESIDILLWLFIKNKKVGGC